MSSWTYINGTITVEPLGRTQAEKRYILETVLNHLPRVTGSERDMNVYIIQKNGYNHSSSCDEYGDNTDNLIDIYDCHNAKRGWLRMQNQYILAVDASLRDRYFNETFREFMKWLCRLSKRVYVESVLVRINGFDKEYVINADYDSPYCQMEEDPSWAKGSDNEPCWAEHLMWDHAKNSSYPVLLEYKYFNNPENDAEVQRRFEYRKRDAK